MRFEPTGLTQLDKESREQDDDALSKLTSISTISRIDHFRRKQIRSNKLMKESNKQAFKEFLKQKPDAKHLLPIESIAEETFVPGR